MKNSRQVHPMSELERLEAIIQRDIQALKNCAPNFRM
jgi:hypothetical protein